MLPRIYDVSAEGKKERIFDQMNEMDDDNVENCVKCPKLNIVIKQVYKRMAPNVVIWVSITLRDCSL